METATIFGLTTEVTPGQVARIRYSVRSVADPVNRGFSGEFRALHAELSRIIEGVPNLELIRITAPDVTIADLIRVREISVTVRFGAWGRVDEYIPGTFILQDRARGLEPVTLTYESLELVGVGEALPPDPITATGAALELGARAVDLVEDGVEGAVDLVEDVAQGAGRIGGAFGQGVTSSLGLGTRLAILTAFVVIAAWGVSVLADRYLPAA